jgi:hypothetical protein
VWRSESVCNMTHILNVWINVVNHFFLKKKKKKEKRKRKSKAIESEMLKIHSLKPHLVYITLFIFYF